MDERLLSLINETNLLKIKKANILLVGLGGVGGFALEALVRTGFSNLTIIDGDKIELSNLNRQIISNQNNLNERKAEVAKKRALSINPDLNIKALDVFLTEDNFNQYINDNYDYIIDACDDIKIKISLIKYALNKNIKIITCLGTGRKLNPAKLTITTLNKTFNDPLAKKLRTNLKKEAIPLNIPVVWSSEEAKNTLNNIGSAIFVPSVAGIMLANYVFLDILKN